MLTRGLAALVAVTLLTGPVSAQTPLLPTRLVLKEADLRGFLPPEGTLIEQGRISIEYVGVALGREVRAQGKRVYVSDRPVGERGFVLRDGYAEINIGAHAEKEEKVAFFKPTFAVDMAARARLYIDDQLQVRVDLDWIYIQGDNLGGKVVVAFGKDKLRELAEREAKAFVGRLNDQIKQKLPTGLPVFSLRIEPGQIVIIPRGA